MRKKKLIVNCLIVSLICFFISLLPFLSNLIENGDSDFVYDNFNVSAVVNDDGSLSMHEEFNLKTSDKHTYIREIFFDKDSRTNYSSNNQSRFDFSSFEVKVEKNDGSLISADVDNPLNANYSSNKSGDCIAFNGDYDELNDIVFCDDSNCAKVVIYLEDGITDSTKYILDYKILDAVNVFNDVAEINWIFIPSLDTGKYNVNLTIDLPSNEYSVNDINYYGYGGINSSFVSDECTNNRIVARSNKLSINEEMEVLCYFPSDLIKSHGSSNYFDYDGENKILERINSNIEFEEKYAFEHNLSLCISIALCVLFIVITVCLLINVYKKYDKELTPSFEYEYYRELPAEYPPLEMGYLYNEEIISSDDFNATLMDLIRKKFIVVDQNGSSLTDKKPNYKFIYNRDNDQSELEEYEKYLLYWYFDVIGNKSNELTLNEIDSYLSNENNIKIYDECNRIWNDKAIECCKKNDFFDDSMKKDIEKYRYVSIFAVLIGIVCFYCIFNYGLYNICLLVAVVLSLGVCFFIYCKQIRRRSVNGNEDYVKWKAFKHFLEEFSHFEDYPIPGIVVWEHYLVYATSFGIADLVEKQLRTKFSQTNRINEFDNSIFYYPSFHSYMRLRVGNFSLIRNETLVKAEAKRMASSSSSGGRGGFGGGSSFGGGGGHSSVR